MYNEVLASPSIIQPVNQENDENLLDLNILSVSPGTYYNMFGINIYNFLYLTKKNVYAIFSCFVFIKI